MNRAILLFPAAGLLLSALAFGGAPRGHGDRGPAGSTVADAAPVPGPAVLPADPAPSPATQPANVSATQPASGKQKSAWFDARVGDIMVYKMSANTTETYKVTKADDTEVAVQEIKSIDGKVYSTTDHTFSRWEATTESGPAEATPDLGVKDLPAETLKISGQDIKCKVTQTTFKLGKKISTTKEWTSDQVPGGSVKTETDATGANVITQELTEFTRGR